MSWADHVEQVEVALFLLGNDPDEVAERLEINGCTGVRYSCEYCPVANYLTKRFGATFTVGHNSAFQDKFFEYKLPQPVRHFIYYFDHGMRYRNLEEK